MSTYEVIDAMRKTAARLSAQVWALKALEATLPEGRSRDVVQTSRQDVEKAIQRLGEEALALQRYAALGEDA